MDKEIKGTNIGRLRLTYAVLKQILRLPDDVEIVDILSPRGELYSAFEIVLKGTPLPFTQEGMEMPVVEAYMDRDGFHFSC